MADGGGGFGQKRFSGEGRGEAAFYKVWTRWAEAVIVAQKAKDTPAEAIGPWLCTLLESQAALSMENVDICE